MLLVGLSLLLGIISLYMIYEWIIANICIFRGHRWTKMYEDVEQKQEIVFCPYCNTDYKDIENEY